MKSRALVIFLVLCFFLTLSPVPANAGTNHTQSEAVAWIQARRNEKWAQDYDGAYGPQCVDLIFYYFDYLVGYHLGGYAYALVGRSDLPSGWTYRASPSPGDIAVWGANVGIADWTGHVALVEWVASDTFGYVDVNGNTGKGGFGSISISNPSTFIHPDFTDTAPPSDCWITSSKSIIRVGEEIAFNYNGRDARWFWLSVDKDGKQVRVVNQNANDWYTTTFSEPGHYAISAACFNNSGESRTNTFFFTVYDSVPLDGWITSEKSEVKIGENISFNYNAFGAIWFWITIVKDGKQLRSINQDTNDWYTTSFSEPGSYSIFATCFNDVGESKTNTFRFTVKPTSVTVKFNSNGGSTLPDKNVMRYNTYGDLPTPTRSGYRFDGWHTAASGGSQVTKDTKVTATANHTLYAHWTALYYLDLNGCLDGVIGGNLGNYGTADVYVNGKIVADDVKDYYSQWPAGATYEIKDIKTTPGYFYRGVQSGQLSGTVGAPNTQVCLSFSGPAIGDIEKTGNAVTARIYCSNEQATVFCGAYRNDGKMISVDVKQVTGAGEYAFQFDGKQFDYAKVFLLDENLKPICEGKRD